MPQQIKGKAVYDKTDYTALQGLLGKAGTTFALTLAADGAGAVSLFSGIGFVSNVSQQAINDSGVMEYEFTISVNGGTVAA